MHFNTTKWVNATLKIKKKKRRKNPTVRTLFKPLLNRSELYHDPPPFHILRKSYLRDKTYSRCCLWGKPKKWCLAHKSASPTGTNTMLFIPTKAILSQGRGQPTSEKKVPFTMICPEFQVGLGAVSSSQSEEVHGQHTQCPTDRKSVLLTRWGTSSAPAPHIQNARNPEVSEDLSIA